MSKSLETEYKNLVAFDIPDLWDRIESNLEERQVIEEKVTENVVAIEAKPVNKRKNRFYIYIPAIAAAAVMFVIAVPAALLLLTVGVNNTKSMTTSADVMSFAKNDSLMFESAAEAEAPAMVEEDFDAVYEEFIMGDSAEANKAAQTAGSAINEDSFDRVLLFDNQVIAIDRIYVEGSEIRFIGEYEVTADTVDGTSHIDAGTAISGIISKDSLVEALEGEIYNAYVYELHFDDGSIEYEIMLQSPWR